MKKAENIIKKSLVAGAVAMCVAVPSVLYENQVDQTNDLMKKVEQQQGQLEHQQKEADSLHKEIKEQSKELDTIKNKNKELTEKNQELEGIRNLVLDTVGYIPSREEIQLLENLVECEAGAEPYAGKVAVANVVFNRVKSDKFPNNIHDVIYQHNQFEPVVTGMIYNRTASEDSKKAVKDAIQGKKAVDSDIYNFWADYLPAGNDLWNHIPVQFTIGTTCFGKEWIN